MKSKKQNFKNKQLKGFVAELETLSKKYGIMISVEPKRIKYANVESISYGIDNDYACTKIYVKDAKYVPLKVDFNKRFNIRPQTEYGFYRDCIREFETPIKALEHWELVHSILVQISEEAPDVIGHYLDGLSYEESRPLLDNKLKENIAAIYSKYIDRSLTNFITNYEDYADMRGWE